MDDLKPGWKTSEFWIHVVIGMLIAGLTAVEGMSESFPPIAKMILAAVVPLALAWLNKIYNDGRVAVKTAAINSDSGAVAAINKP